jgi:hypothetical protein
MKSTSIDAAEFFRIVDNPDVFNFKGYNLFKVFYFAFERRQLKQAGVQWKHYRRSGFVWGLNQIIAFLKTLLIITKLICFDRSNAKILYYGSNRTIIQNGITYDIYNARLGEHLERKNLVIIEDSCSFTDKIFHADFCLHSLAVLVAFFYGLSFLTFRKDLKQYAHKVVTKYPDLGFIEKEVEAKVLLFWAKFQTYKILLTLLSPRQAVLIAHAGKEAFIAACQSKKIRVTELMHGLISPHPFYEFPKTYAYLFPYALFPNRLGVYGEYWKQTAIQGNMFPENSVVVCGYYLKLPIVEKKLVSTKKIILFSTQGIFQQEICDYIQFLKTQLDESTWRILIKLHPDDVPDVYKTVVDEPFVTLTNQNPYELLAQTSVHISIYSTLLYEAIRYKVSNYVLLFDHAPKRVYRIIDSGVAFPLYPNQLPDPTRKPTVDQEYFFAEFNPNFLFST